MMKKGLINMTKYNIKQTPKISILVVSKYIYIYIYILMILFHHFQLIENDEIVSSKYTTI